MARPRSDLELHLLRKGVGALGLARPACSECGRTPLSGERVHVYERGALVCALCRPRRRQEPQRTELVPHAEHGHSVRRAARAA